MWVDGLVLFYILYEDKVVITHYCLQHHNIVNRGVLSIMPSLVSLLSLSSLSRSIMDINATEPYILFVMIDRSVFSFSISVLSKTL
jgi:hypothetical protein